MGFRSISSLIILLVIVMMIFGTKRLREVGNDLAVAIRSFRKGLQDDDQGKEKESQPSIQEKNLS